MCAWTKAARRPASPSGNGRDQRAAGLNVGPVPGSTDAAPAPGLLELLTQEDTWLSKPNSVPNPREVMPET